LDIISYMLSWLLIEYICQQKDTIVRGRIKWNTFNNNNRTTFQREQQQAVTKVIDETRDNIKKTTNEARKEIPRYTQIVNDYQENTIQAIREITDIL